MKKILSMTVLCFMLLAMLAPAASAEDGIILFQDSFEDSELNPLYWSLNTAFYLEQGGPTNSGHIEGYAEAVVQQSAYGDEAPAPRVYGPNVAFKADCFIFEDGGKNSDDHSVALWWADHIAEEIGTDRIVYTVTLKLEERKVVLTAHGEGSGQEFFPESTDVASWDLPANEPLVMDANNPTVFNLGMRINGNQIDGFYNDKKVVSFTAPRMGAVKCPVLLWNTSCHCGFDNVVVATANYNLFNESAAPEPGPGEDTNNNNNNNNNNTPDPVVTKVETKVEEVTDASGNAVTDESGNKVTQVVSEVVTVPAADTNTGAQGNGGAQTGDMAVVVAAVMVIALGSALAVKKISVK